MADEPILPFIKLTANPYIIPDDLARELAAIVIEWGGLENVITVDLEQLRMFSKLVRDLSDAIPRAFGAKLKLWRRSYSTVFPTIKAYNDRAEDIFTKTRIVGLERHRIIHGWWRPDVNDPSVFHVLPAMDRVSESAFFTASVKYLAAVHEDINKLSNAIWSLNVSRQLHASQGLLQRQPAPSGERQAPPSPPTPEKS